jgi:hypothetical protein
MLEATAGIEPADKGFADLCLTTWLRRLISPVRRKDGECSEPPQERQLFLHIWLLAVGVPWFLESQGDLRPRTGSQLVAGVSQRVSAQTTGSQPNPGSTLKGSQRVAWGRPRGRPQDSRMRFETTPAGVAAMPLKGSDCCDPFRVVLELRPIPVVFALRAATHRLQAATPFGVEHRRVSTRGTRGTQKSGADARVGAAAGARDVERGQFAVGCEDFVREAGDRWDAGGFEDALDALV